jgi:hypothetical protein
MDGEDDTPLRQAQSNEVDVSGHVIDRPSVETGVQHDPETSEDSLTVEGGHDNRSIDLIRKSGTDVFKDGLHAEVPVLPWLPLEIRHFWPTTNRNMPLQTISADRWLARRHCVSIPSLCLARAAPFPAPQAAEAEQESLDMKPRPLANVVVMAKPK